MVNYADLFSQLPLLIFSKGANISGWHCSSKIYTLKCCSYRSIPDLNVLYTKRQTQDNIRRALQVMNHITTEKCNAVLCIQCSVGEPRFVINPLLLHLPSHQISTSIFCTCRIMTVCPIWALNLQTLIRVVPYLIFYRNYIEAVRNRNTVGSMNCTFVQQLMFI